MHIVLQVQLSYSMSVRRIKVPLQMIQTETTITKEMLRLCSILLYDVNDSKQSAIDIVDWLNYVTLIKTSLMLCNY